MTVVSVEQNVAQALGMLRIKGLYSYGLNFSLHCAIDKTFTFVLCLQMLNIVLLASQQLKLLTATLRHSLKLHANLHQFSLRYLIHSTV